MISSSTPATSAASLTVATATHELDAHFAVRHQVFVLAQGLFHGTDRDARDDDPATLHAIAAVDDEVVGAVRLYRLSDDLWKGDRLAVLPSARIHSLGGELVRFAVRTASACGGRQMVAQVQVPNVRFFERLGWVREGTPAPYVGIMHQPMAIPLRRPAP